MTRREGSQQVQQGTAAVSYPVAFTTAGSVVASSQDQRFWAGANGIGNSGFTATLISPSAVVGNQTATVDWAAVGR